MAYGIRFCLWNDFHSPKQKNTFIELILHYLCKSERYARQRIDRLYPLTACHYGFDSIAALQVGLDKFNYIKEISNGMLFDMFR